MNRRSVLCLLVGVPAALSARSVLATAQQAMLALGGVPPNPVWSAGGNQSVAIYMAGGTGASSSAALSWAGFDTTTTYDTTYEYNGASWSAEGALPASRKKSSMGIGSNTDAICLAGLNSSNASQSTTYGYNGTSWSTGGAMLKVRSNMRGCGTGTASFVAGGSGRNYNTNFDLNDNDDSATYNGATWTNGSTMANSYAAHGVTGTQGSALVVAGKMANTMSACEKWNGSSFSATGSLNTARDNGGVAGASSNSAIYAGGTTTGSNNLTSTESFGGSTWATVNSLLTGRQQCLGAGNSAAAIVSVGFATNTAGMKNSTENYA